MNLDTSMQNEIHNHGKEYRFETSFGSAGRCNASSLGQKFLFFRLKDFSQGSKAFALELNLFTQYVFRALAE